MTPDEMRDLSRNYFKRHKTDPFGSTWILSSTVLLVGAEILERLDNHHDASSEK